MLRPLGAIPREQDVGVGRASLDGIGTSVAATELSVEVMVLGRGTVSIVNAEVIMLVRDSVFVRKGATWNERSKKANRKSTIRGNAQVHLGR